MQPQFSCHTNVMFSLQLPTPGSHCVNPIHLMVVMQEYCMFPLWSDLRSPRKIGEVLFSNCDLSSLNICYSLFETVHLSFPFCGSHLSYGPTGLVSALIDGEV